MFLLYAHSSPFAFRPVTCVAQNFFVKYIYTLWSYLHAVIPSTPSLDNMFPLQHRAVNATAEINGTKACLIRWALCVSTTPIWRKTVQIANSFLSYNWRFPASCLLPRGHGILYKWRWGIAHDNPNLCKNWSSLTSLGRPGWHLYSYSVATSTTTTCPRLFHGYSGAARGFSIF